MSEAIRFERREGGRGVPAAQPLPNDVPGTIPSPLTAIVGRSSEIAAITEILVRARLVTLTGPGGAGKTRLAIEVATQAGVSFPDGVTFVPLAGIRDAALVLGEIGAAFGVRQARSRSLFESLRTTLSSRSCLIVLDNIEQVVEAGGDIARLLDANPHLRILATGRSPFRIYGEHRVPVAPLSLPVESAVPLDATGTYGALDLFAQRARASRPDFAIDSENLETVIEICRRLDGLPLAIELAAARIRVLSPNALRAHLSRRLVLLTGGAVDQPARLQTMRAAIAWSYDLLSPETQRLFRALAVFSGGFTQAAVAAVGFPHEAIASDSVQVDVLDALTDLVDRSLISLDPRPGGDGRFTILETIAEFGWERVVEAGEVGTVRDRHAAFFLGQAEEANLVLRRKVDISVLTRLDADRDNLRSALNWLESEPDRFPTFIQMCGALGDFWYLQGYVAEGRTYLDRALGMRPGEPGANWIRAVAWSGSLAQLAGDAPRAARDLGEALTLARAAADPWAIAFACMELGAISEDAGAYDAAEASYREALANYRLPDDATWIASAWYHLGIVAFGTGDLAVATERLEASLATATAVDEPWSRTRALTYLGIVAIGAGQIERAVAVLTMAAPLVPLATSKDGLAAVFATFASLAVRRGRFDVARRLFGAAERCWSAVGTGARLPESRLFSAMDETSRLALGEPRAQELWDIGVSMTPSACIAELALVLADDRLPSGDAGTAPAAVSAIVPDAPAQLRRLTARERQVLGLLGQGLTDRQIADTLSISHLTARTHVRNVLAKLDVATRGAAAAFAARNNVT